jgi:hypothetical protein
LPDVLLSCTGHIGLFNFFELHFEIDGLVAYYFCDFGPRLECFVGYFLRPVFSVGLDMKKVGEMA